MDQTQLKILIEKSLAGETTPEEEQILEDWYSSFDEEHGVVEQLTPSEREQLTSRMLRNIQCTIDSRPLRPWYRSGWMMAAASLFIAVLAWYLYPRNSQKEIAYTWKTISSSSGNRIDTLPDGSVITLRSNSELRYREPFSKRDVQLEGQAYFDVAKDASSPFVVHAGTVNATVLGTEFDLERDSIAGKVQLTVTEGKVSVMQSGRELGILTVDRQILLDERTGKYELRNTNAFAISAWRLPELVFKAKTFGEIASVLEKRFRIDVKFSGAQIKNSLITASFNNQLPPEDILKVLCRMNGNRLEGNDGKFLITRD